MAALNGGGQPASRWWLTLLLALPLALGAVAPAAAQYRGLARPGVQVYYQPRDEAFARTALAAAAEALPTLRSALGLEQAAADKRPIRLTVVRTLAELNQLAGLEMPYTTQGVALSDRRIVVQTLAPAVMRIVVAHEVAHVLLDEVAEPLNVEPPRWLHEGLAKLTTDDFTQNDREILGQAVVERRLLRLDNLETAFSGPPEQVALAYAQSYTLVRYLDELQAGSLRQLLRELALTGDTGRALLRTYGQTPEKLEAAWQQQVRQEYLKHGLDLAAETLIFGAMALLFVIVLVVTQRRRRLIRERLQDEERLQRLLGQPGEDEVYDDEELEGEDDEDDEEPLWPPFR